MKARGVPRIAARIAIELEEERKLYGHATARACAVPGAVSCVATRNICVHRVVAIASRIGIGDHFANFIEDGCGISATRRGRRINVMSAVCGGWPDLSICTGVLVAGLGVVGVVPARVVAVNTGDLIAG